MTTPTDTTAEILALESRYTATNYEPLDVVLSHAQGAWATGVDGRRYLDALSGYSALNFGHGHPRLLAAAHDQLDRLTLTSRAFHSDRLGAFSQALAELCGKELVLPMNTGAEAVETALKAARRWGYRVKGVAPDRAHIVTMAGNFHGRTTTVVGFSTDEAARSDFGPFAPGFVTAEFGDAAALEAAIDDETVAVLLEPIQGERGVIIPPEGYLQAVREICTRRGVLLVADEIQSGLARTGQTFACDHEGVVPDVYVLGKALGGGIVPVSAVVANADILDLFTTGSHGSTFGGNPFGARIGAEVVAMLRTGEFQQRARELEGMLREGLDSLVGAGVVRYRLRGAWAGVDVDPDVTDGHGLVERLARRGVLSKETHGATIRFAPPLVSGREEIHVLVDTLGAALRDD